MSETGSLMDNHPITKEKIMNNKHTPGLFHDPAFKPLERQGV